MPTSSNATYDPSSAALRPLMNMFWSAQGWRDPGQPPPAGVLAEAVAAGVMFAQPRADDHDGWVAAARSAVESLTADEVGDAFLESLGSRRLDLRSSLGSYAVARVLPEHHFTPNRERQCAVCGLDRRSEEDLNVLNFERFKWGGVRRDHISYVAFDLEQFARAPRRGASEADRQIGRHLIDALRHMPAGTTASQASRQLITVKGNLAERQVILDILGVCGILQTPEHHGYSHGFVPFIDRADPPYHFVERAYPVSWWKGSDGVHDRTLQLFLPAVA